RRVGRRAAGRRDQSDPSLGRRSFNAAAASRPAQDHGQMSTIFVFIIWSVSIASASRQDHPDRLPQVPFHLTARPWKPLGVHETNYLDVIMEPQQEITRCRSSAGPTTGSRNTVPILAAFPMSVSAWSSQR